MKKNLLGDYLWNVDVPIQSQIKEVTEAKIEEGFAKGKPIFVGIYVHKRDWTVHVIC